MRGIVSGLSGRALIIDGDVLKSFEVDDPSKIVIRQQADLPYLFGDASDLRIVENAARLEWVALELLADCSFTWALDLILISLDADLPRHIREEALQALVELLAEPTTNRQLRNVLYAAPLPEDADFKRALILGSLASGLVSEFLVELSRHQETIRMVRQAWEDIPTKTFAGEENRHIFQHAAVRSGLFRVFVEDLYRCRPELLAPALERCVLYITRHQSAQLPPNHHQILEDWTANLRRTPQKDTTDRSEKRLAR